MPKIKYESINFSQRSLKIIQQAESIVTDYKAKGYDLTLRQVYYQFVSRDWLPQEWADPQTGKDLLQRTSDRWDEVVELVEG